MSAALASAGMGIVKPIMALHTGKAREYEPIAERPDISVDTFVRTIIESAIDAAKRKGATYADARLTHTIVRSSSSPDSILWMVGVRAIYNGYWGFASSPVTDEALAQRLGIEAVAQAKANANALLLAPPVDYEIFKGTSTSGHWETPVLIDPLSLHPIEIRDYISGIGLRIMRKAEKREGVNLMLSANSCSFSVEEKAFGSSEGSYWTQRRYTGRGALAFSVMNNKTMRRIESQVDLLEPASIGWELYNDQPIVDAALGKISEMQADLDLPLEPITPGRYDVVLDARSVSRITHHSIAVASELDRALGYEANATGTTYLDDPATMPGNFRIGYQGLDISANRSEAGGLQTVRWDDDGVEPASFKIVENGVFQNYLSNKQSNIWAQSISGADNMNFKSNGNSIASNAGIYPYVRPPNIRLEPSSEDASLEDLCKETGDGLLFCDSTTTMDFQCMGGLTTGNVYSLKKGRKVASVADAGLLFRTLELWNNIRFTGGAQSQVRFGVNSWKGEPPQEGEANVTAVPIVVEDMPTISLSRR